MLQCKCFNDVYDVRLVVTIVGMGIKEYTCALIHN